MTLIGSLLAAAIAAMAGAWALRSRLSRDPLDVDEARGPETSGDLHWSREIDPVVVAVLFILVGLALAAIVIAIRLI